MPFFPATGEPGGGIDQADSQESSWSYRGILAQAIADPILIHTTSVTRRDHALTASRRGHALSATRRTHDIKINEP